MLNKIQIKTSAFAILNGAKYIKSHKNLYKYIYIPIIINIFLFIILSIAFFSILNWSVFDYVVRDNELSGFITVLIGLIIAVTAFFIVIYTFNTFSSIVNGPVYEFLIEEIFEIENIAIENNGFSVKQVLLDLFRSIKTEIKKFILLSVLFISGILVNLIPVLGQILFILITLLTFIIFNGLSLYEPMMAKSGLSFRVQVKTIIKNRSIYWPNILISGFLISIPLLNVLTLPFAIAGSIKHYLENKTN